MTDAVWIKYTELRSVSKKLEDIITEFNEAGSLADALQDAIARPFFRSELRDKAGDFESRWDDKRGDLARDIGKVYEHVAGIVEGFAQWDEETAQSMEVDASGQSEPQPAGTPASSGGPVGSGGGGGSSSGTAGGGAGGGV